MKEIKTFKVKMNEGLKEVKVIETFEHIGRIFCIHKSLFFMNTYSVSDYLTGMLCLENSVKSKAIKEVKDTFDKNPEYSFDQYEIINP